MSAVQHDLQRRLVAAVATLLDDLGNQKGSIRCAAQFDYRREPLLFKPLCTTTAADLRHKNGPDSCSTTS